MSAFFTADWHFGDPRVEILGRPFADADEMATHIITQHNATVSRDDTVYMLGDALHKDAGHLAPMLGDLNGDLILIRGNHDTLPGYVLRRYFSRIVPEGEGLELDVDGLSCWLTHYPTMSRPDRLNLVAHVHGTWRVQPNMLNVGVDVHHFRPVTAEQVRFYFDAICGFYDEDVWVADHPANLAHADRGKPGTYLESRRALGRVA